MWDSNSPLKLLNTMPRKLTKENLEKLQLVIDADKYKNSLISGFDLCGMYAPFCRDCKKTSIYPCAIAYINLMKASGMDIEIDAQPVEPSEPHSFEVKEPVEEEPEVVEEVSVEAEEEVAVSEPEEPVEVEEPVVAPKEEVVQEKPVKRRIRIAIARRKL